MYKLILPIVFIIAFLVIFYYIYTQNKIYSITTVESKFSTSNPEIKNLTDKYNYNFIKSDIDYYRNRINGINTRQKTTPINNNINNRLDYDILNYDLDENIVNQVLTDPDSQNIHDSYVQKKIKQDFKQNDTSDTSDIKESIDSFIKNNNLCLDYKHTKVMQIIDDIKQRNSYISSLKKNEYDILNNTWNSGNFNVKCEIINQLYDCHDPKFNTLYCPTGVSTRIIEAMYIENPENSPKTKHIINQEMLNTASNLKQQNPDMDQDKFKELLINTYIEEYKDIMTEKDINNTIKDWIEHI